MITELKTDLGSLWSDLSGGQKFGLCAALIGMLAGLVLLMVMLLSNSYAALFTGLNQEDAAEVVEALEGAGVEYKLAADGATILVDENKLSDIKLKLVSEGVPTGGGVGFEVFDDADYGMTEFMQKINFQRALQGELARTIVAMPEVKKARVHLVLHEKALFKKNTQQPKASVTVLLEAGKHINTQQVNGIKYLVAAAVQGMSAENVIVLDQNGVTLAGNTNDEFGAAQSRWDQEQTLESSMTTKIDRVLDRLFGPGKAIANISVRLNYDQVTRTTESVVTPEEKKLKGVLVKIRESKVTKDVSENKKVKPKVVNSTYEADYQVGKEVEQIIVSSGNIDRITVGILVPGSTSDMQIESIKSLIAAAVGLDFARGDSIDVQPLGLQDSNIVALDDPMNSQDQLGDLPAGESGQIEDQNTGESWLHILTNDTRRVSLANPTISLTIVAVFVLFIFVFLTLSLRSRKSRLSSDERDELLREVKGWLSKEAM